MNNKFLYSAIGDNTPENREHLEKLGMQKHPFSHERGDMIATYTDTKSNISFYLISWKDTDMLKPDIINCIGNPALFQAVTAMRDDSDYMQWFKMDKSTLGFEFWYLCEREKFESIQVFKAGHGQWQVDNTMCFKATLAELQEHFK